MTDHSEAVVVVVEPNVNCDGWAILCGSCIWDDVGIGRWAAVQAADRHISALGGAGIHTTSALGLGLYDRRLWDRLPLLYARWTRAKVFEILPPRREADHP